MVLNEELIRDLFLNPYQEEASPIVDIFIVKEPNGEEGLAVKQKDGHIYKYTVDTKHEKYNTLPALLKAAQALSKFRKAGPVLGWIDRNAILYAGSKKAKAS